MIRLFFIRLLILIFVSGVAISSTVHSNIALKPDPNKLESDMLTCATTEAVPIGQTLEFLLFSEGDPTEIKALSGELHYFDYYYYHCSNITYILNTETGYICNAQIGRFTGSCPPDEG